MIVVIDEKRKENESMRRIGKLLENRDRGKIGKMTKLASFSKNWTNS